jgi:predicted hydrolase (HD superfamily)
MITKQQALELIREHVLKENIVKHMLTVQALMEGVYDELKNRGKTESELGGTREEWGMAGLLHDGDYCEGVPDEKQGIQIVEWARNKDYEIPDNVAHAMAAHNWPNTKVEPKNLMDWTIFCGDSLTGLIVAATLVLPDKKMSDLTADRVLKRFKEPSFAKGTRRDEIAMCEEKIGLTLEEFVSISLKAIQGMASEIGL